MPPASTIETRFSGESDARLASAAAACSSPPPPPASPPRSYSIETSFLMISSRLAISSERRTSAPSACPRAAVLLEPRSSTNGPMPPDSVMAMRLAVSSASAYSAPAASCCAAACCACCRACAVIVVVVVVVVVVCCCCCCVDCCRWLEASDEACCSAAAAASASAALVVALTRPVSSFTNGAMAPASAIGFEAPGWPSAICASAAAAYRSPVSSPPSPSILVSRATREGMPRASMMASREAGMRVSSERVWAADTRAAMVS